MIPYGRQFIDEEDIASVISTLKSDFITQGSKIEEFEGALAHYCGAKYAVVFNSGTSALHAAYFAAGLSPEDEFIVPAITFCATANAGVFLGARPIFADVQMGTGNIDSTEIEKLITSKTKLIVPVHYAGNPAELEEIWRVAQKYNLKVVEDACHALGAEYKGEKIGSCQFSDMTVFSFHPVKHITTGEGGAVLTNSLRYYEMLLKFRNHGVTKRSQDFKRKPDGPWYYEMQFLGYNYRMTDFQAALGISQLKKLDWFVKRRREIARKYDEAFRGNAFFDVLYERPWAKNSYHLYAIILKDPYKERKREIFQYLRKEGLGVQVHYIPVYKHPFYRQFGYEDFLCSRAEDFYKREISIPIFPGMKDEEIEKVKELLLRAFDSWKNEGQSGV